MRNDGGYTIQPKVRYVYEAIEFTGFDNEHYHDFVAFVERMKGTVKVGAEGNHWGAPAAMLRRSEGSITVKQNHFLITRNGYFYDVVTDWQFTRDYVIVEEDKK